MNNIMIILHYAAATMRIPLNNHRTVDIDILYQFYTYDKNERSKHECYRKN